MNRYENIGYGPRYLEVVLINRHGEVALGRLRRIPHHGRFYDRTIATHRSIQRIARCSAEDAAIFGETISYGLNEGNCTRRTLNDDMSEHSGIPFTYEILIPDDHRLDVLGSVDGKIKEYRK